MDAKATLKADTMSLLRRYRETGDARTRNRLVELNIGLVRQEAHRWIRQCRESFEDLVQVGGLGLIQAIERFDLSKGAAFSSFAVPYIRGEIQHYLRDRSNIVRIPRRWADLQQRLERTQRRLETDLGRAPRDRELAEALEISDVELQEVKLARRNRRLVSLDTPVFDEDDHQITLGELMPDQHYRSFQIAEEDRLRLNQALQGLETRTRQVLEFVYIQDLTQKETADHLGISPITVSRQLRKGLTTLRTMMAGSA
jgi:RNA polymerase sigma-B factor